MPYSELDWARWLRDQNAEFANAPEGPPNLSRYPIRDLLGEGATAIVYRAWDRELHRAVALKILREKAGLSDVARQRFRREAQAAAGLTHPNVVAVYDAGEEQGRFYLVMELVEGRPLGEFLKEGARPEKEIARLMEKAARGAAAAHEKGIVHRDLKPANILVTSSGEPKVGDLGLAHLMDSTTALTRTGTPMGTPLYMAPEQVQGRSHEITPRTDVYALGAILYEALTGHTPHSGDEVMEIYRKIVHEDPAPPRRWNPDLSRELETIVLKALEKEPERRYPTAEALAEDLRRYGAGEPVAARPATFTYRTYRKIRKNMIVYGFGAAAAAAVLAAATLWLLRTTDQEAALAAFRNQGTTSLQAALAVRRAGGPREEMRRFLIPLENAYREVAERAPRLAEVEYLMGRMYRALMEDEKALEYQEQALVKDPGYAPALYERAVLRSRRYGPELEKAYTSALILPPGPVTAESARKIPVPTREEVERSRPELVRMREGIVRDGTDLERRLRAGPVPYISGAHVPAAQGILTYHQGRHRQAQEKLEAAVAKDPFMEEAWEALLLAAGSQVTPESGDWEERIREQVDWYSKAIEHDKGYTPFRYGRGNLRSLLGAVAAARGEDPSAHYAAAEQDWEEALRLDPQSGEARRRLGQIRSARGFHLQNRGENPARLFSQAEENFAHALRLNPSHPEAWARRGMLRTQQGLHRMSGGGDPKAEFAAAAEDFARALERNGGYAMAWNWSGVLRTHQGLHQIRRGEDPGKDFEEAEARFNQALRFDRGYATAWKNRGLLWIERGMALKNQGGDPLDSWDRAGEHLDEALRLNKVYPEAFEGRGRLRLERALLQDNDRAEIDCAGAVEDYRQALRLNPALKDRLDKPLQEAQNRWARLKGR